MGYYRVSLLATVKPTFSPAVSHVIRGRAWGAFIPLSQEACSLIMHKQDKKLLQCFSLPPTSSPLCPDVTSNLNTHKSLREESFPSSSPKPTVLLKGSDCGGGGEKKPLITACFSLASFQLCFRETAFKSADTKHHHLNTLRC